MKQANLTLTTDDKTIEYSFDIDNQAYRSVSKIKNSETGLIEETVSEEGPLGDQQGRDIIAKRIYYILQAILKA